MVVGDKVRVTGRKGGHGMDIGYEPVVIFMDLDLENPDFRTIKVKDEEGFEWWLWEGEFEPINQEQ
jgi:hypothetical protein